LLWGWFVAARVIADPSHRLLTYGSVAAITKESWLVEAGCGEGGFSAMAGPANFDRARMLGH